MLAAAGGKREAAIALLESGADSGARDRDGMTALMIAEKPGRTGIVEVLKNSCESKS